MTHAPAWCTGASGPCWIRRGEETGESAAYRLVQAALSQLTCPAIGSYPTTNGNHTATGSRNRDRGAAIVAAAPPTPPGMRVRTGRFERLRS